MNNSITIKDVARLCGVSVSTVSRAMNNHPDINKETKDKIMETIAEYNYIPNNSARNLKRTETKTIAVLIKGMSNPFFYRMMEVFQEEISNMEYSFVIHQVDLKEDEIEVASELIKEKRLKGIVFLGGSFQNAKERFKQISVPFVLATIVPNTEIDANIYSHVSVDDVKESKKIVDYLCEMHHEKIAMLVASKDDVSISKLRIEGYRNALEEHGIPFDSQYIVYTETDEEPYSMENGYDLTKKLLKSGKKFTAIYAISDRMAVGACRALVEAGLKIPEDVSVAGFDGLDISSFYHPTITTIRQPVKEIARETIRILFQLIRKEAGHQHRVFEGELVVGESTRTIMKRGE